MKAALDRVREQIRNAADHAGRDSTAVTLIAVSKTHPFAKIAEAYHLGVRDFGENYAQELAEKAEEAARRGLDGIRWHYLGPLQSNKLKLLSPWVYLYHGIDREDHVQKLHKVSPHTRFLLQVNYDREPTKHGIFPEDCEVWARKMRDLAPSQWSGWMVIPDPSKTPALAFQYLRKLPNPAGILSMGMSDDFTSAIQEGATHVRIGTAIFGERTTPL